MQAVPVSPESFASRKALPEVWRGLRDDELSKTSGVDGCVFVHASGFIGGEQSAEPFSPDVCGDRADMRICHREQDQGRRPYPG